MAKKTVAELFRVYRESVRLQLMHHGDEAGKVASESSSVLISALSNCKAEVEVAPEVEIAIRNIN